MSNRLRCAAFYVFVVLSFWGTSGVARAQFAIETSASLTTGYTNEPSPGMQAAPDPNNPGVILQPPGPDVFFEISPGLAISLNTGRVAFSLVYGFFATYYANATEASSYNNHLVAAMLTDLSARVRFGLSLTGAQGRTGSFAMQGPANATVATTQLAGDAPFATLGAIQTLSWQMSSRWDTSETVNVLTYIPLDEGQAASPTINVDTNLRLQRRSERFFVGGRLGTTYTVALPREAALDAAGNPVANTALAESQQIMFSATLTGRYDFNTAWSAGGEFGAQMGVSADFSEYLLTQVVNGSIDYRHQRGTASLSGGHGLTPNVLVGEQTINDNVRLGATLLLGPLDWALSGSAALGYAYQRAYSITQARFREQTHVVFADAGLDWRVNEMWALALRYQFSVQKPGGGSSGESRVAEFTRHAALFSVRVNYPPRSGGGAARRAGRSGTASVNVGGADTRAGREEWDSIFEANPGRK